MLATTRPVPAAIEGQPHRFECMDCEGSGKDVLVYNGGQDEQVIGTCATCEGNGELVGPVDPEDCSCSTCKFGFWVWLTPVGERKAMRFDDLPGALHACAGGEVTKRHPVSGKHERVATVGGAV